MPLLFQLLTIFVSAKLVSYVKFYQSNKDFIESLGEYAATVIAIINICGDKDEIIYDKTHII